MSKRVTSIEVAKRAGVSQSTVSRVFSENSPNVSAAARQKVLRAADELGYQPNIIARMMSTRKTNIVGIVMANITSPFYPYVLEQFLQALQAVERQVLLFTASDHQTVDDILPLVWQHRVDALIITSATLSSDMAKVASQQNVPVILFNRVVNNPGVSAVCADNVQGGRMAADALLAAGCRHLAFIAGTPNTSTSYERECGFMERLHEQAGVEVLRAQGAYTYESGFAATQQLLEGNRPDAIFAANDIMALGALDAIRARGLQVGDDVSVIGYDNIPMAAWGAYQLTTISQDINTMIERTVDVLLTKLEQPNSGSETIRIPGQFIVRQSLRNLSIAEEEA